MDVIELWWLSLALAAVVVIVVAVLLGLIIAAAKSIDVHAEQIWIEGKKIAGNTVSIWMLEPTNRHLGEIADAGENLARTAAAIEAKLGALGRAQASDG
jgi:hypothetical protein